MAAMPPMPPSGGMPPGGAPPGPPPGPPGGAAPPVGPANPQSHSLLQMILAFMAGAGLENVTRAIGKFTGGGNKGMGPDPNRPHRPTGGPQGGGAQGAAAPPLQGPPPAPAALQQPGQQIPPEALQMLLAQLAAQRQGPGGPQ